MAFFIMFCKVYESYALDWLKNHMLLSWGLIGLIANGLWIKNNVSTIKKRWDDDRYYVSKHSIIFFVLFNLTIPAALCAINERIGVPESTTVYGKLVDVKIHKGRRGSKSYPKGTFYINEKGYNGFVFKSIAGYEDVSSLHIKIVVKKGFLGWEWLQD